MQKTSAYEDVPYPSFTFPQSHPDRMATMAAFHGMSAAKPENCRFLELGCGNGSNLLSFAYALPNSEFVGIDLANVHIESANQTVKKLAVSNVTFYCEDVMNFMPEQFGEFDFIIAHGLFSWVPDFVRAKVLEIYARCLAPNGIGYISYNVYPGCHIREMMWEMMQFHIAGIPQPAEQLRQGTGFLRFVHDSAPGDNLYKSLIGQELSQIADRTLESVFHDDFSELNQPFYFHEFAARLEPFGLKFLCEAEPQSLSLNDLSPNARQMLDSFSGDINRREQYLDFIKCRRFRNTLVCRSDIALNREPDKDILKTFFITSDVRSASDAPKIGKEVTETFVDSKGKTFQTNHSLTKAVIISLGRNSPRSLRFEELMGQALNLLNPGSDFDFTAETEKAASFLVQLFYAGLVKLHTFQPIFAVEAGEFPTASAFARWQIEQGNDTVTTLTGTNLKLDDDFAKALLLLSDGTRDRTSLISAMTERIKISETDTENSATDLPARIEIILGKFAGFGLLVT